MEPHPSVPAVPVAVAAALPPPPRLPALEPHPSVPAVPVAIAAALPPPPGGLAVAGLGPPAPQVRAGAGEHGNPSLSCSEGHPTAVSFRQFYLATHPSQFAHWVC